MNGPASPPLRILQVEVVGRGGLAHYAYNLSRALAERGHRVTLATAAAWELEDRAPVEGLEVHRFLADTSRRLGASLPGFAAALLRKPEAILDALRVARLARRLRPDVIHLHSTQPIALLHLGLLRRSGRRLVATAHVVTPHERLPLERPIYRRIYKLADLTIAHSRHDRRRLERELKIDATRVEVIPHGEYGFFEGAATAAGPDEALAARRSLGLGLEHEVALFFGYIREYKGLDVLLEAWPAVAAARPAARLVVAGDPVRLGHKRRSELEAEAERLGVVGRFDYVPFSEVRRYFAAADVLVMPYRHISQSGVLYLALALGVPVVATRVGALPEMLEDGGSALLVPPESPGELGAALTRALADPHLRRRLARGGRRIAAEHSWPAIARQTESAYTRAL